jgi:hypothetical protein
MHHTLSDYSEWPSERRQTMQNREYLEHMKPRIPALLQSCDAKTLTTIFDKWEDERDQHLSDTWQHDHAEWMLKQIDAEVISRQ